MAEKGENKTLVNLDIDVEDCLQILSQGEFRCPPCQNCHNSDPSLIEVDNSDSSTTECTTRPSFICGNCKNPYVLADVDDGDKDQEDISIFGIECCKCRNAEPACFQVDRLESGLLHTIVCLVCGHGNTFNRPTSNGTAHNHYRFTSSPSDDSNGGGDASSALFESFGIECTKCPNKEIDLFEVTKHPNGRIHKIKCWNCGHGNTFHEKKELSGPKKSAVVSKQSSAAGSSWLWDAVSAAGSGVRRLAFGAADQGVKQVMDNVQNNRGVGNGIQDIGIRQGLAIGEHLIVMVGGACVKRFLPMIPQTALNAAAHNLCEYVKFWAMEQLKKKQNTRKKGETAKKGNDHSE